jgi:hypothetical protein
MTRIPALRNLFGPRCASRRVASSFDTTIAYVHQTTGNDATAQLGNNAKPYLTMSAAAADLVTANPGAPTTIVLQSHFFEAQTLPKEIYNATAGASLTIDGVAGFIAALITLEPQTGGNLCEITLKDIQPGSMVVSAGVPSTTRANFGTIYIGGTVNVTQFTLSEPSFPAGATGAAGTPGDNLNGTPGGTGATGFPGDAGGDVTSTGGVGGTGGNGKAGWSVSILEGPDFVACSIATLTQDGCAGGTGGVGGGNTFANGGAGGQGGDGVDDGMGTPANGADGGAGGNATATGGDGGVGGVAGDGGDLTRSTSITPGIINQVGGQGGFGGAGGTANATGGAGGAGGNGVNGGGTGNTGSAGSTSATNGSSGTTGSNGNNGSTTVV